MRRVPFDWSFVLWAHVAVHIQSQEDFETFCENLPREVFRGTRNAAQMKSFWMAGQDCFRFERGVLCGEGTECTYCDTDGCTCWPNLVFAVYDGSLPHENTVEVGDLL